MRALDDITVVEISSNLAAAYAAMLLAEQGARAIKLEPPGGAPERGSPHFHVLNRSKRSFPLDCESAAGAAALRGFIRRADVVVSGFTPARTRALGVDYDGVHRINPRALVLTLPPLGSNGPLSELEADEDLAAAIGGIPGSQWARSGNPVALTFPAASYSAGVMGAAAAVAALCARGAGGAGQAIEVSILAGALSLQTGAILRHEKMTTLYHGGQDPLGPVPCYRLFEAADGRYLFIACGNSTFWNKFALALDRPDLVSDPRFENAPWGIAPEHWQTLKDILEPIIRTRPCQQWLELLRQADVPCAPVLSRREFIDDAQVRFLGMRRELADPILGPTVQMGMPIDLHDTPGEIVGPAPAEPAAVAADTGTADAVAAQAQGNGSDSPGASAPPGAAGQGPLAGVLVLDFASYIAGSYGPMILAQLGADVIKIESLEGDSFRHFGFGFLGWNQQKRGLALNLNRPEALEIVYQLADRADVLVENLRPGRMRRFGLDYQTLSARNPRLVYMSVNGFGNRGPDHDQPGFDPLLQARSGVMAAQGGHHDHPVYLTCAICDYGAAMLSAFGCILALRARQRCGRGQLCETTLLQAAMAFQAGEFNFYAGRPDLENGAVEYRGHSALRRAYQCSDGTWLFVAVSSPVQWESLRALAGDLPAVPYAQAAGEPCEGALAAALGARFEQLSRSEALERLAQARVAAAPVNRHQDLFDDPQILANDLLAELDHSEWGRVQQTGMLVKFSATPGGIERAAPLLGEHAREVLGQYLGFDAAKVAELRARGIVG